LLQEAQICARDEAPAVYAIAQLLLDRPDEMIEILKSEWHYVPVNSIGLLNSDWTSGVKLLQGSFLFTMFSRLSGPFRCGFLGYSTGV
jgi:hypothetical protein